jgi:hypothetical protein
MKFAKATKFHRKSGQGLGINPEDDLSAVGAALTAKGYHRTQLQGKSLPSTLSLC